MSCRGRGDLGEAGDELDLVTLRNQKLGEPGAHEVALAVEDGDARSGRPPALEHDPPRRQDVGQRRISAWNRLVSGAVQSVRCPVGSGCRR